MTLFQIVPKLPPEIDGVTEFALVLAREFEARFGIASRLLTAEALATLRASKDDWALLHYSGYGYDRRGVPEFLARDWEVLKGKGLQLAVYFHELWVETVPWRSAFYFAARQRKVACRLGHSSRVAFTSTPRMQRLLAENGTRAILAPVPGSIPQVAVECARNEKIQPVVFGQEHTRARTVQALRKFIELLRDEGRLGKVTLLGKTANSATADYKALHQLLRSDAIRCVADADSATVAAELASASCALSFYPLDFLTKSSTVMACLANRCPVILPRERAREPFQPEPPVLLTDGSRGSVLQLCDPELLASTGEAAAAWYREHASSERLVAKAARAFGLAIEREASA